MDFDSEVISELRVTVKAVRKEHDMYNEKRFEEQQMDIKKTKLKDVVQVVAEKMELKPAIWLDLVISCRQGCY